MIDDSNFKLRRRKATYTNMAPVTVAEALVLMDEGLVSFSLADKDMLNSMKETPNMEAGWVAKRTATDLWFINLDYAIENFEDVKDTDD